MTSDSLPSHRIFRTIGDLSDAGLIAAEDTGALAPVAARYAVAVTPAIAALIDPDDAHDPIARQFIPTAAELVVTPNERADPIGDAAHSPVPGVVHRYPDRVLLKLTHICPVYCRFCFRREMVGPQGNGALSQAELENALGYIAANPQIFEVIITGGDPFVLSARRISEITRLLSAIPHLRVIRWHTRVPVVQPEKITPSFVRALTVGNKAIYVALHANHPRELTPQARRACDRLIGAGIVMLSQSVLLKGVNDSVEVLADLMRAFVETRIKPYYLHHGDLAPGTSHFRTKISHGQTLMRDLRGKLSGLCQPTYVLDVPGGHGKVPLAGCEADETGAIDVTDWQGKPHHYPAD